MRRPGSQRFASKKGASARTPRSASKGAKGPGSASNATDAGSPSGRHGKFNAAGEFVNGIWQASAAQAERYRQLLELEARGYIDELRTEVPFDLRVNNVLICRYRADFTYRILNERGSPVGERVEDVKGMVTPEFNLKHKLFDALLSPPLSVLHVKGKAKHRDHPDRESSAAGWVDRHWRYRLPDWAETFDPKD